MTLSLLENITHNDIIKPLRGKKDHAISKINVSSVKGQALFPYDNKKEKKNFLYREIKVSKHVRVKPHVFKISK